MSETLMETVPDSGSPVEEDGHVRPWARFVAKQVDLILLYFLPSLVAGFLFGLVGYILMPEWMDSYTYSSYAVLFDIAFGFAVLFLIFPVIEGLIIGSFGTSPGKALMGIRLTRRDGQPLGAGRAIARSYGALFFGLGMGLPLISLIAYILSYNKLQSDGITRWDDRTETVYHTTSVNPFRWIIGVVLAALVILANVLGSVISQLGTMP